MAFIKRKPPGGNGRLSGDDVDLAGFDAPRDKPDSPKLQARRRDFARAAVFAEFGYRSGRALDYDGFVDRRPDRLPKRWWAAHGRRCRSHRKSISWWRP